MIIRPRVRKVALRRGLQTVLSLLLLWTCFDLWTVRRSARQQAGIDVPLFGDQKVFIASLHWTDELVLRDYWIASVVELAREIGPSNVFVSVYESGSLDDAKGALRDLQEELLLHNIPHKVVLDETTHLDEVSRPPAASGWIQMPATKSYRQHWTEWFTLQKDEWVPRRIPYLARLRNLVMHPLYEQQMQGITYDRVLWLNDVVFTTKDVRALLATRNGNYAAACALDFKQAPAFYDTFALRDADGYAPLMDTWPYFQSALSRKAIKHSLPVPVASCWNGMLAFDAAPFYDAHSPLLFRGVPDDLARAHLEGSESCLIHADNPLSADRGVWVNPQVRVGYNGTAYDSVNSKTWPSSLDVVIGIWRIRFIRWFHASDLYRERRAVVKTAREWKAQKPGVVDNGAFCLIDEMQILLWNGWGHA
ncbi:hypothetical protein LTR86_007642 [Recurvomyces mirabilis]|nr:hypothetical protein LTR86_007642 [Recurvomyces mirabilis]